MRSGSALMFRCTVNLVSLALAVTPPADAEEIQDLTPLFAIRRAVHTMSEAFVLAASGSRRLDEDHDDAHGMLVDLKKKAADMQQRLASVEDQSDNCEGGQNAAEEVG